MMTNASQNPRTANTPSNSNRRPLVEVAASESARFKGDPNVIAVGIGLKETAGKVVLRAGLRYYVRHKAQSADEVAKLGSALVPREVEGYETDVVKSRMTTPAQEDCGTHPSGSYTGGRDGRIENPLVGGTTTIVLTPLHAVPIGSGTLGGICFDEDGAPCALSNQHVWYGAIGDEIAQPVRPPGEYVEATLKLLLCGPVPSYVLDTTVPSALTAGLAAASAVVGIAACLSDAEDPSRWGQRTTAVPGVGVRTLRERVGVKVELPLRPFAGMAYAAKATWGYARETTAGTTQAEITADRPNEHVLAGKRVWTEQVDYRGGEVVRICAQVLSATTSDPRDYHIIAICYPAAAPERVVRRILRPMPCGKKPRPHERCVTGFEALGVSPHPSFPIKLDGFHFDALGSGELTPTPGSGLLSLSIPTSGVRVAFQPGNAVRVAAWHTNKPVAVRAFNLAGIEVAHAVSPATQGLVHELHLEAPEIAAVVITGGGGEGHLAAICVSQDYGDDKGGEAHTLGYSGQLELDLREPAGTWNIVLEVQTVDNTPVREDPLIAAAKLGGVTASPNFMTIGACGVVMALDHLFNVI